MTELHSNNAGYIHLTSGLSRSFKKLIDGLFQLNRVHYLSKVSNLLVISKNIHKDYNQQNATHPCAYGVAVRGFEDTGTTVFVHFLLYVTNILWPIFCHRYRNNNRSSKSVLLSKLHSLFIFITFQLWRFQNWLRQLSPFNCKAFKDGCVVKDL